MSLSRSLLDRHAGATSCLTLRSLLIGCGMCVLVGLAGPYWNLYMVSSGMFADYNAAGPVFFLAALIMFNVCLAALWRRLRLSGGELRAITAMTLVAGSIVTSGLVAYLVPGITAPYYHATEANQIHVRVWPYLRRWLFALDPGGGTVAISKFWSGIPQGEPIPWGPWIGPLFWWAVYVLPMFACMIALMSLMRKQWVDYEHLSFPIAQVPAELCAAAEGRGGPRSIVRSKAFWIGAGFAFAIGTSRGLHGYFPFFPTFKISHSVTGLGPMDLRISVSLVIIGLTFLIPNRVAFSIWSLNLASWALRSFIREYQFGLQEWMLYGVVGHPELTHVSMGAIAVFSGASLVAARGHLARALACALGRRSGYDRGEPTSYRTAFFVMLVALVVMLGWLVAVGMRLHYAAVLLLLTFAIYYGLARVIAQCGLPAINSPVVPSVWMASAFGSSVLGSQQAVALGNHMMWHADLRNSPMSGSAHGMYLTGRRSGGLFWAMMAALAITYVVATLFTVRLAYHHGASSMHPWYISLSSRLNWMWTAYIAQGTATPSVAGLLWTAFGAAGMAALIVAQRAFFWWPIHPVGFLTSGTYLVTAFWFSVFLAWLAKVLIVYAGGSRAYRLARRLFIGAVLGSFVVGGVWAVIDTITGLGGNTVFSL